MIAIRFSVSSCFCVNPKVLDALRGVPWPREYSFRFLKNKLTDE
jgi:hypothetical protein